MPKNSPGGSFSTTGRENFFQSKNIPGQGADTLVRKGRSYAVARKSSRTGMLMIQDVFAELAACVDIAV